MNGQLRDILATLPKLSVSQIQTTIDVLHAEGIPNAPITPARQGLTERQQVVLFLVLEGLPNKLIARRLGLAVNTVKQHVAAILKRLGARRRIELISRAKPEDNSSPSVCPTSGGPNQPVGAALSCSFETKALGLTNRQGTVLLHLLDGMSNKEIAQRLGLTENTVRKHISAILLQLGACSRLQVISKMRQISLASPASTD
ncbi:LuxR C-terminal-related transcriptional regulator [Cupriavidus basilensis]|uniref:LuxR C-terminal-related transcriptional regulator n=1 Tax=Cupriavidus basilensis TaxID=68895 RepID=A0ABT6ANI8_9BURK|nr:LuxR C-terminal-related transcriptional regulator [Cupriavidus basilensis]MDF3834185.1 LuxR C-terminal-related transcriptional regulator [Cupriavidus basilensis]